METITLTELIKVVQELPNMILPAHAFKSSILRGKQHRVMLDIKTGKEIINKVLLPSADTINTQMEQVNITDQNFDWVVRNKILITEDEFRAILTSGEALIGFLYPM